MIKSITVTNDLGNSIKLELMRPELSGFIVKSIEGLGPAKANINTTTLAMRDGSKFNSAYLNQRDIVMNLIFMQRKKESIEDVRHNSYKYFPIKKEVTILVETDKRICQATGYVEANEPEIFSDQEGCSVTISCPDPLFYSPGSKNTVFYGIQPEFYFVDPEGPYGYQQGFSNDIYDTVVDEAGFDTLTPLYDTLRDQKRDLEEAEYAVRVAQAEYDYIVENSNDYMETIAAQSALDEAISSRDNLQIVVEITENDIRTVITENDLEPKKRITFGTINIKNEEVVYYDGEADIGISLAFHATGPVRNITIYNATSEKHIYLNTDKFPEGIIKEGDTVTITSERDKKRALLLRDGVLYNVINSLGKGTVWFTLTRGDNVFSYDAEEGSLNLQFTVSNKIAYDGV